MSNDNHTVSARIRTESNSCNLTTFNIRWANRWIRRKKAHGIFDHDVKLFGEENAGRGGIHRLERMRVKGMEETTGRQRGSGKNRAVNLWIIAVDERVLAAFCPWTRLFGIRERGREKGRFCRWKLCNVKMLIKFLPFLGLLRIFETSFSEISKIFKEKVSI